ncbi:hypothetical protein BGW36DRAFT_359556 [Talaromyces proteolyticus]|uniref:Uncharacterized protein n=1 Tax=Talaromyces proteolyticus TaxID=1131652 RepID=A0AAD4KVI1_9EURO|nr:uncharacterized protein BGW36DRAFT_359556 [Talaromyces proteolyticus]KAH8697780.1 hypothetical protein BGW36DRAFT_359556 [Talaromyces proteolyticus]
MVTCIICGYGVGNFNPGHNHARSIFSANKKWVKYRNGPGYHFLNADEVEKTYFDNEYFRWKGFYRLIMYNPLQSKYWLSGIGQHTSDLHSIGEFPAPTDYNKAFIGIPPQGTAGLTPFYDAKSFDCLGLPVIVHMRCWNLAQWVLGSTLEINLELFVAITLKNVRNLTLRKDAAGVRSSLPHTNCKIIDAMGKLPVELTTSKISNEF